MSLYHKLWFILDEWKINCRIQKKIIEKEGGLSQLCLLSILDVTQTIKYSLRTVSEPPPASSVWSRTVWVKEEGLISAHLLQVGRQQMSRRKKLFLFVNYFSLTHTVAVCACRDEVHVLADGMKKQPLKAGGKLSCVNWLGLSIKEAHKIFLKNFKSSYWNLSTL